MLGVVLPSPQLFGMHPWGGLCDFSLSGDVKWRCHMTVEGEDGIGSKRVVGFMWHGKELVNETFPLYVANTYMN